MIETTEEFFGSIRIDESLDSYSDYLPDDDVSKLFNLTDRNTRLDQLLCHFMLDWRSIAYTASMPYIMVKSLDKSSQSYMAYASPPSSILSFADAVIKALVDRLPDLSECNGMHKEIRKQLVSIACDMQEKRAGLSIEDASELSRIWAAYLKHPTFALSLWSCQRTSYVAFYGAYESFVVNVIKESEGMDESDSLRTTEGRFKTSFKSIFGEELYASVWSDSESKLLWLVRNALVHNSGGIIPALCGRETGIEIHEGKFQVMPNDNKRLVGVLCKNVIKLVEQLKNTNSNLCQDDTIHQ